MSAGPRTPLNNLGKRVMAKKKGKKAAEKQIEKTASTGLVGKVKEFIEFFEESKVEIKKVVWPTRKETITTCVAVLVVSLVVALYLGLVDLALSKIVEAILS
jgi:preprotein translocase subunit SecE